MTGAETALRRYVSAVDAEGLAVHGVHVLIGDDEVQHRWRSDDRENVYSVSKGVCVLAVGIAVADGLVGTRSTVDDLLPGFATGAGAGTVTLHDLLTMSSGIDFRWYADQPVTSPDLAREMLARPTVGPGTAFQYSDASTYVAMRMLGAVVGDVRDWLLPRLFDPLDIHNPQWHRCPRGSIMAGSGLELRTRELARFGRLLRDRGTWEGQQLVPAEWVDDMARTWVRADGEPPMTHYGLGTWQGPGRCWRWQGRYGQLVVVDPEEGSVVTVTAHEESREDRLVALALEALDG